MTPDSGRPLPIAIETSPTPPISNIQLPMKKSFLTPLLLVLCTALFAQDYERYKTLTDTTISSAYLGFDKQFTVTVPLEWQADIDRRFPLIVVFDSQNERSHGYILRTIDYLTSNEQMPAAVIISVRSEQAYRYLETAYKASDEKGLAFENEQFLFEELIPLAEKHYKASAFRVVVGHSRYGFFTSSILFSRLEDLNGIISLSPFFTQKNIAFTDSIATLQDKLLSHHKYYRFGIGNDYPDEFLQMEAAIGQRTHPMIDAKGVLFEEADHNVTPGLTIGVALYEVFEVWANIQHRYFSISEKDPAALRALEEEVASHYGHGLAFALGILNGKGWEYYNKENYEAAIVAWEIMMASYPNFSEGFLYILDAQMQLKREEDYADSIKRFRTSISGSAFYTEEEKAELIQELEAMTE